jgi:hypothetical protein
VNWSVECVSVMKDSLVHCVSANNGDCASKPELILYYVSHFKGSASVAASILLINIHVCISWKSVLVVCSCELISGPVGNYPGHYGITVD